MARKKYKERQQRRAKNTANNIAKYQKNCDKLAGKKRTRQNNNSNNSVSVPKKKKQRTITFEYKYKCCKCGKQYKYEKRFKSHKCK